MGIPAERQFATKIELGWRMIQRVKAHGLPFEVVACDDRFFGNFRGECLFVPKHIRLEDSVEQRTQDIAFISGDTLRIVGLLARFNQQDDHYYVRCSRRYIQCAVTEIPKELKHLVNRSRSTRSRLRAQRRARSPT